MRCGGWTLSCADETLLMLLLPLLCLMRVEVLARMLGLVVCWNSETPSCCWCRAQSVSGWEESPWQYQDPITTHNDSD